MLRLCLSALAVSLLASRLTAFDDGIRLAWEFKSAEAVTAGVYARMAPTGDGAKWLLAYSDGPSVYVRDSSPGGLPPFSAPRLVANAPGYDLTNAELTRLANGWIILGYNARPQSASQGVLPYEIRTLISRDQGRTWADERVPYTAGKTASVGCWEPIFLQRPSGEVLLFFANEAPYSTTAEQEIGLMRSADHGLTWDGYATASFRAGSRDGMPVPLLLADGKTLVFAIEDNGLNGLFKPAIIASTATADWGGGPVGGNSPQRWPALRADVALPPSVYAGAPYLTRLSSGETLLSVQSTENRLGTDHTYSAPRVYVGGADARDFARPSTPFPWLPATASGNWNSLAVLSDDRIALLSSLRGVTSAYGPEAIWQVQARVLRPIDLPRHTAVVDGIAAPGEWPAETASTAPIYIGGNSKTEVTGSAQWDDTHLYLHFSVNDARVWSDSSSAATANAWEDDGVEFTLDPLNASTAGLAPHLYKAVIGPGGETRFYQTGAGSTWVPWDAAGSLVRADVVGTANNNADDDTGYRIELSLPWTSLGGRPAEGTGWGVHVRLHDDNDGAAAESHEDLGGNSADKPATWMRATLRPAANLQVPVVDWPAPVAIAYGTPLSAAQLNATADVPGTFVYTESLGTVLPPGPHVLQVTFTPSDSTKYASASKEVFLTVTGGGGYAGTYFANISARAHCTSGNGVTIGGFVVSGREPKRVLIRAVGPTLTAYGLAAAEVLSDPVVEVHDASHGNVVLATNDNWSDNANAAEIVQTGTTLGAGPLLSSDSKSSALLLTLAPGAYSFVVRGKSAESGIVLLEVFDAAAGLTGTKFVNIAARALAGTGNAVAIGGFVIGGNAPKRVLVRAVGPTLTKLGIGAGEVLVDPTIEVHAASHGNQIIGTNDNWSDDGAQAEIAATGARIGATPFDAADTQSAAMLLTLPSGPYTFIASGKNGGTGIVLVEVYDAD